MDTVLSFQFNSQVSILIKKQLSDVDKKIAENASKNEKGADEKKNIGSENAKGSNTVTTTKKDVQLNVENKTKHDNVSHKSREEKEEVENEDENENKIRGYKLTSDGRKTTFFNNELDEKTKALIGSIAPQKIKTVPGACDANGGVGVGGGSAWNAAGTFESVDHCKSVDML